MMTAPDIGQFIVEISDDPIDQQSGDSAKQLPGGEALVASVLETVSKDHKTVVIRAHNCFELEESLSRLAESGYDPTHTNVVIPNLLDAFYDTSILTREAARSLGRVKCLLDLLVENGIQVIALCQRRSDDLGTRSHFMASLCASADHVYFRRRT